MILLHDFLKDAASRDASKPAIICADSLHSFGEIDLNSDRIACKLQESGISRGDRVAVLMNNSAELVMSVFGIVKAGGVFVIINPTTKAKKLAYILNDCGVRALISEDTGASVVRSVRDQAPSLETVLWADAPEGTVEPGTTFREILNETHACPIDPGLIDLDLCAIIYTSGSTGEPKGVMLTHGNLTNTAWAVSTYLENMPDDVVICALQLSFGYGLLQVITGFRIGFTVVLERSFAYPYKLLQRMAEHHVTGLPGVPTIFATLLQMAPFEGLDLSSLRYLTNAGAACPPAHIRQLQELFSQAKIFSMYGLTECTRVCYLDPDRLADKITSVGKAMPNSDAYIVDENGQRVGPNVTGELVVRGANVMRGYWGKPDKTNRCLRDGDISGEKILYSGDLFRMDEEGLLYFVARKDDVFNCGGEKISPKEVEDALYELDAVAEAAVIGVSHPIDGHAIKAIVVLRDGMPFSEQDIRRHCRICLEKHLVPRFIEIRDELPKTGSGKIKKSALALGQ
jgi:long-chain acyl-CoA synthetase